VTPSGIETETFQLLVQYLNKLHHHVRQSFYLFLDYLAMLSVAKHIASNGWMMIDLLWLIPLRYVHTETNKYPSNAVTFWIF
jgi:hypothetical protein